MQRHAAARLAAVAVITLASSRVAGAAEPVVHYRAGRVTVHVQGMSLAAVLQAIGRDSGALVRGEIPRRDVTADLDDVPLDDALGRLLGRDSFALTYARDGRLRSIDLLAIGKAGPAWPPPGIGAPIDVAPERAQAVMGRRLDVGGRLAAALGTQRPTAGELVHAAFRQEDWNVRGDAQRRVLAAFAADPELQDVFSRTLRAVDDDTLARIFRDWNVDGAKEFMRALAMRAREPELRAKAAAVLASLATSGPDDTAERQGQ